MTDLTGSGTPSASSSYSAHPASYLTDDNGSTAWWSNTVSNASDWLKYDFGTGVNVEINTITLNHPTGDEAVQSISLSYSDNNSSWTELETRAVANASGVQTFPFSNGGAHRYWRVNAKQDTYGGSGTRWKVIELEMGFTSAAGGFMTTNKGYW